MNSNEESLRQTSFMNAQARCARESAQTGVLSDEQRRGRAEELALRFAEMMLPEEAGSESNDEEGNI